MKMMRTEHFKYGDLVLTWLDDSIRSKKCVAIVICMVRGYNPSENFYIVYTSTGQRVDRRVHDIWEAS
jgi:hypothetical protein